ncbi:MAG: CCA tRNA nucleotidyltransferase [Leptonema sp. (in: bacteria)]
MVYNLDLEKKINKNLYTKIVKIAKIFKKYHYECFLVGGWIRDILLNTEQNSKDIDIATNARPEEVMRIFPKVIPTGIKHGTVTIFFMDLKIECTTYRTESKYSDHRHPDTIEYAKSIFEDLSRRDFTINAFAYDPLNKIFIDEYNGLEDLKKKIIRCIGNPKDRFLEDGLRPIRACRFRASLGFGIEENTKNAILDKEVQIAIKNISVERFTEELKKGFLTKNTSLMLESLYDLGIFEIFLGKLKLPTKYFYFYLDSFLEPEFKMALWIWYGNLNLDEIYQKLKLSKKLYLYLSFIINFINFFIYHHPYRFVDTLEELQNFKKTKEFKEFRKILSLIKKQFSQQEEVLNLIKEWITHIGFHLETKTIQYESHLLLFFDALKESLKKDPLLPKDLSLKGSDFLNLGFKGKQIGKVQKSLLELVLEKPEKNQRETLLKEIENIRFS